MRESSVTGGRGKESNKTMSNNKITNVEREKFPTIIDAALLAGAAEPTSGPRTRVIHRNALGVAEGLHRKMGQLLDHLS